MAREMKENQHVQPIISDDFTKVTFMFKGLAPLTLDMEKVSEANRKRASAVGFAQVRLVDAAAISATDKDGNIVPEVTRIRMKRDAVAELIAHYETGTTEWSRVGQGGGGKSLTIEAIARVQGIEYDRAEADVAAFATRKHEGDTKAALAFLRKGARVMAAMEAIRAERAPKPAVDADAALEDLKAQ